jgi:hypothetical protein
LPHAEGRADWRPVRGLFQQQVQLMGSGSKVVPVEVMEAFADAILAISASPKYVGSEAELCEHALAVLAAVESQEILDLGLFRRYYEDDRYARAAMLSSSGRRWPAPYEAIIETCRRLRDARRLRVASPSSGTSGVLVGSASYGRFYNVRGNRASTPASDLDFIVVIDQADALDGIAAAVATLPGIPTSDVERFIDRARVFADKLDDGRTVFSHKVRLWADGTPDPMLPSATAPADYPLSLHIVTRSVLDYILVASTPRLRKEAAGTRRTVRDYREESTVRWDDLRDFSGRRHRSELGAEPTHGGWLRSPLVYYIDELDCYFPGFYQTMLLPHPDLLWDDLDVRPEVDEFPRKLRERVLYETSQRPYAMLRTSFAHVRREAFAPSVVRRLDTGYSRP